MFERFSYCRRRRFILSPGTKVDISGRQILAPSKEEFADNQNFSRMVTTASGRNEFHVTRRDDRPDGHLMGGLSDL